MSNAVPALGERQPLAEGELLLPRPPGAIRRFLARHPWFTDGAVVAIYLVPTLLSTLVRAPLSVPEELRWTVWLDAVAVVVSAAALLFRRYRPVPVLVITTAATLAMAPLEGGNETALPFVLYALAVYASVGTAWIGFAVTVAVCTAAAGVGLLLATMDLGAASTSAIGLSVIALIATLIGVNVGNRKRYVQALVDRANQLVRERDQQAQLAAASERSRIAREMHDIVSHSLTVMVTLAEGSAAAASGSAPGASAAMRQVADTGRQALGDMRRMLGVLHSGDDAQGTDLRPQPGIADLDDLVSQSRAAGLPVGMTTTGDPPDDAAEQLAIYRVVQESLTNALRHAGSPTVVTVELEHGPRSTVVRVADDGSGVDDGSDAGHGLLGMRQRVALYGGTVEAGPGAHGGWVVTATIPRGAST